MHFLFIFKIALPSKGNQHSCGTKVNEMKAFGEIPRANSLNPRAPLSGRCALLSAFNTLTSHGAAAQFAFSRCQAASCYLLQFKWLGIAIYRCRSGGENRPLFLGREINKPAGGKAKARRKWEEGGEESGKYENLV